MSLKIFTADFIRAGCFMMLRGLNLCLSFIITFLIYKYFNKTDYLVLNKFQFIASLFGFLLVPFFVAYLHGKENVDLKVGIKIIILFFINTFIFCVLTSHLFYSSYTKALTISFLFAIYMLLKQLFQLFYVEYLNQKKFIISQISILSFSILDLFFILSVQFLIGITMISRFFPLIIFLCFLSYFWDKKTGINFYSISLLSRNISKKFWQKFFLIPNSSYPKILLLHNIALTFILQGERFLVDKFLESSFKVGIFLYLMNIQLGLNAIINTIVDYIRPYTFDYLKDKKVSFPLMKYILGLILIVTFSLSSLLIFWLGVKFQNLKFDREILYVSLIMCFSIFLYGISYLFDIIFIGLKEFLKLAFITTTIAIGKGIFFFIEILKGNKFSLLDISLIYMFFIFVMSIVVISYSLYTLKIWRKECYVST